MFVVVCAFLVVVPVYVAPFEVAMGLLITLIGIPFYQVGVVWKNKPKWVQHAIGVYKQIYKALLLSHWLYRSDLGNRVAFGIKNKALFTFLRITLYEPKLISISHFSFI